VPLFAIFDASGKFLHYLGELDEVFQKAVCGYAYASPKIRYWSGKLYYTDGTSGMIIVVDTGTYENKDSFRLFDLPEYTSRVDYTLHPLDYITGLSAKFISNIIDFQVLNDKI
jgi:hypothetical protein